MNDIAWPSLFETGKLNSLKNYCKIPILENIDIVNALHKHSKDNTNNDIIKEFVASDANTMLIEIILKSIIC